jgi:hypothetical protein
MQVYGSVSHHVMNIMGTTVMEGQYRKHLQDLLHPSEWGKHVVHHDTVFPSCQKNTNISFFLLNPPLPSKNKCFYRMQTYNHVILQGVFLNQGLDIGWISQIWLVLSISPSSPLYFFGFPI